MNKFRSVCLASLLSLSSLASTAQELLTPKAYFGFNIGDNYRLANYTQLEEYFSKLASQSDRVKTEVIGQTEEGRNQYIWIVSSPENIRNLSRYKALSQRLARAEGLSPEDAKKLSAEGKSVVWIDGGLHANETVGAHQLIQTYYELLSRNDEETKTILDNVIILLSQVNPDGQELMSNWYMQHEDSTKRNLQVPRLYQKYIGHDNNRDFFMMNMKETTNISRQQYIEWMPQIIYNHHQRGPAGSVLAGPPYRDPFNHVFDPLVITGIDGVAASMHNRLNTEDKPGYTRLSGSVFSTWWNGGLRTTPYFHNMIGILTEIIGNPTPEEVPLIPERLIPNNATPNPVTPQAWPYKKSIDYSVSLNYAILDYASRHRNELLFNIYKMGRNAIDKGSRDNWTLYPKYVDSLETAYRKDAPDSGNEASSNRQRSAVPSAYFEQVFGQSEFRDARAYIIPVEQADFPTAVKFVNALIKSGIQVHQAGEAFSFGGKQYGKGSYVVKTAQAFRAHVLDMFEPQNHPNDFQYPGGPPVRPYDAAGWTLAYQMGVVFDRVTETADFALEALPYGELQGAPATSLPASKAGYFIHPAQNDAFTLVNDLLTAGFPVWRITQIVEGETPDGSFYVSQKAQELLSKRAAELGVNLSAASSKPAKLQPVKRSRIALFDQYGGSMPSGWVRWLMEQYHFPFEVIYPQDIDAGGLRKKYDAVLFISGGIPPVNRNGTRSYSSRQPAAEDVPEEFRPWLGEFTTETSLPQIRNFLQEGGVVITVGSATNLAYHLDLGVSNALVDTEADGEEKNLNGDQFYIPSSILEVSVQDNEPANWGFEETLPVVFNNSPLFRIPESTSVVKPLLTFEKEEPLLSGWAWGQHYLKGGVAAFYAPVGKGTFYAYGPEITSRGQSHVTFKALFNQLFR